jgi:hypothetical protein
MSERYEHKRGKVFVEKTFAGVIEQCDFACVQRLHWQCQRC